MIDNTLVRSIDSIIEGLKEDNDNLSAYDESIKKLVAMGYTQSYVDYIGSRGMEYIPEINGLLSATTAQVAKVNELWAARGGGGDEPVETKLPSHVGQVIMSTTLSSASAVAEKYEGTWTAWGQGRMPLGAGGGYAAGQTGGASTHTLSIDEMPSHDHNVRGYGAVLPTSGGQGWRLGGGGSKTGYDIVKYNGGSQAHNNMPPYQVLYMWVRTA